MFVGSGFDRSQSIMTSMRDSASGVKERESLSAAFHYEGRVSVAGEA